jgi:Tol biopolymer transport system component
MKITPTSLSVSFWCLVTAGFTVSGSGASIVSSTSRISDTGGGNSTVPSLSGDGRYVLFLSEARNLTTNDDHTPYLNVYLHDLASTNVALISVNASGIGGGDDNASAPTISSNGQWVAFQSAGSNLAANDTNRASDIFLRDVVNGTTTLITRSTNAVSSANGASTTPLLSSEGGRVIFESAASDLVVGDTNGAADIFAFNVAGDGMLLVSADTSAAGAGNGASEAPSISGDGRFVAFVKRATNDVTGGTSVSEIYLRDLEAESTAWVSGGAGNVFANPTNRFRCTDPSVSENGDAVAFLVSDVLASTGFLFRYDRVSTIATLIASNVPTRFSPAFSGDGRCLTYASDGALFVHDHQNGSNHLASTCAPGGVALEQCHAPSFSASGNRVAFIATQNGKTSAFVYDLATDCVHLASFSTSRVAASAVPSSSPAISWDGHLIAFESLSSDIVSTDYNQSVDVFVGNLEDGTVRLISRRTESRPPLAGMRPATLTFGSSSADGSVLAFSSWDGELTSGDVNTGIDLFVRNLKQGTTQRVNASNVTTHAGFPATSADGRYVEYLQNWTNFLWMDLETGVGKVVEVNPGKPYLGAVQVLGPLMSPNGRFVAYADTYSSGFTVSLKDMWSEPPLKVTVTRYETTGFFAYSDRTAPIGFSPDGKWLAFVSPVNLLSPFIPPGGSHRLYAYHLEAGTNRFAAATNLMTNAVFSANSRYLFFQQSPAFSNMVVQRHDLLSRAANQTICENCWNPSPDANGRLVAVQTFRWPGGASATNDVYVVNSTTGESNLVSANISGTGGGNGNSYNPLMSYDGRYVVFTSKASDLVPNDNNNAADVFVRDLHAGTTMLVSRNIEGTGTGNGLSSAAVMSADGRTVFFQSFANDLAPGDYNQARDIYALTLGGPDTDGDGMDDDWEMASFSTLARDGSGDFDNDGQTDLQEFRAGTDPANNASILRVLTLTSLGGGGRTILWSAAPGRTYRVQFKTSVDDAQWSGFPGLVTAAGTTASMTDSIGSGDSHRFYRVMLVK